MAVVNEMVFGERARQAELQRMQAVAQNDDTTAAEQNIKAVMDSKARLRVLLSFVAGLFISGAGVRTLQGLMVTTATVGGATTQLPLGPLFVPVDVLMTAGLIAGGSQGLAFLAQVLKDMAAPPPEAEAPANPGGGEAAPAGGAPRARALGGAASKRKPARNLRARLV